jgi:hypothetical protein
MRAINLRVREETLVLARALTAQRGLERAALLREALELGMLLIAASGPPAEDGAADHYGTLAGLHLAQRLRPRIASVVDFLSRYGATPLAAMSAVPQAPAAPDQHVRPGHGGLAVDDSVNDALDAFGVGALGDN